MHEARQHYEPDTVVEEVAIPRASTDELTMQTYVNGEWHRRMPDLSETSCGLPIDFPRSPVRRNELGGDLCATCHTPRELAKANAKNLKEIP